MNKMWFLSLRNHRRSRPINRKITRWCLVSKVAGQLCLTQNALGEVGYDFEVFKERAMAEGFKRGCCEGYIARQLASNFQL